MRKGIFEFRESIQEGRKSEIVAWSQGEEPFCYTICWFFEDSEGYNLESVGDRIVTHKGEPDDLVALITYAFKVLNAKFDLASA